MITDLKRQLRKNKYTKSVFKRINLGLKRIKSIPGNLKDRKDIYNIFENLSRDKYVFYFGVPRHINLGDQAQAMCIRSWITENYPDYSIVEIFSNQYVMNEKNIQKLMQDKIKPDDVIVFQSGYTMQPYHPDELVRRIVISLIPDNRIIILPQTIKFDNFNQQEKSAQIYRKATRLTLLARDSTSFEVAKNMIDENHVFLYPDIVTSLIGTLSSDMVKDKDILLVLRNDSEQFYLRKEINMLKNKLLSWSTVDVTDTSISPSELKNNTLKEVIYSKFEEYSKYKLIITDRYHGTIFSLISGTPVIVLNSTDHKLSSGVKWFEGVYDDYVFYAENLDCAYNIAKKIFAKKRDNRLAPYFKEEYFDKLLQRIQN